MRLVKSRFGITTVLSLSSLFWVGSFTVANAETVLIQDDFSDGAIDTSKWITGGDIVTEHDGILDIQQNSTDAGGWVKTVEFTPTKKIRLEVVVIVST